MPDAQRIVAQWLREHGYDGLYCEGCSCTVDDLAPCCSDIRDCKAGHKVPCPGPEECPDPEKCPFHIGRRKAGPMKCPNPTQERCGYRVAGDCLCIGGPPPQCVREGQTPARATDSPPGPEIAPDSGTQEQETQYYEATKEVLDSLKWMAKDMDYRRSQTALCAEPLSPEMQQVNRLISEMQSGTLFVTRVVKE